MPDRWRQWVEDVLHWGRRWGRDADEVAEVITRGFRGGVKPPPPDDTGTPLAPPPA